MKGHTMRALVIHPNTSPRVVHKDWTLAELQAEVGGYIESLPTGRDDITIFGNEEAKFAGEDGGPMPLNGIVTVWLKSMLADGDYIAGPVVVIGYDPETGENLDLPETFLPKTETE